MTALSVGAATLWIDPRTPWLQHPQRSLLIAGALFKGNQRLDTLTTGICDAIEASDGRFLVDTLWGRYLAFWRHPRSGALTILRDPSGAFPLFRAQKGKRHILFTHPELAIGAGLAPPAIDWNGIAHALHYRHLPTARTGLVDVTELLPGERWRLGPGQVEAAQLWRPMEHNKPAPLGVDPAAHLRATVFGTIAALTRDAGPVLLELSGGLDSSIVAAGLAAAGADWRAATSLTPGPDGDERAYAKLVTDRLGVPLETLPLDSEAIDFLRPTDTLRVRPSGFSMLSSIDHAYCAAARGAALISGTGGDNVFCYLRSAVAVVDQLRRGQVRGAWRSAGHVARLTASTRWTALHYAARYALRAWRRPDRWVATSQFLNAPPPPLEMHPWLERMPGQRPGSRAHISLILRARSVLDALERAQLRTMYFPLLAQPVVEACLAIPSWNWVEAGRDRSVARQAFARDLPAAIIQRRSKGRIESLLLPAYTRQRPALVALLASGRLARAGVIDVQALERAVQRPVIADDPDYFRILELVDAELWAVPWGA